MTACDEGAVGPASRAPLMGRDRREMSGLSARQRQISLFKERHGGLLLHVTLLTGDDLFMKLVAAVVQLVRLPVPQEHFTAAHLHMHTTRAVTRVRVAA